MAKKKKIDKDELYNRFVEIEEWENAPIEDKLEVAHSVIEQLYNNSKRNYVAFSGGKNSTVALYLTLQHDPDVTVLYVNTGVQYPETRKYVMELKEKWKLNLIEAKPETTFWKVVEQYGLPNQSRLKQKPMCCLLLKEKPAYKVIKKKFLTGQITGLSAFESRARKLLIATNGLLYYTHKFGRWNLNWRFWSAHPLAYWTDVDVFNYMEKEGIPINPAYKKYELERTGCVPCTAHLLWEEQVAKVNPKLYEFIQKLKRQNLISNYVRSDD